MIKILRLPILKEIYIFILNNKIKKYKSKMNGVCLGTSDCDICPIKDKIKCYNSTIYSCKYEIAKLKIKLLKW